MNTYAFLIKAKAKSGAKNLFCWLSAKSDSRAQREIENILEDAEIETGRGADYQLPVRTNWLIVDDLPAEGVLDDSWCDRYELGEDGKSWSKISREAESVNIQEEHAQLEDTAGHASVPAADVPALLRPVARLRLPQRLIAHLLNDTEVKEISEAMHVQIGAAEADESNLYIQNLLQACRDVPGIDELSAHVEWKLIQAVKELFPLDQNHEISAINGFISAWVEAEPGDRPHLVKEWAEINNTSDTASEIVQEFRDADVPALITVATLPFRQRLLAQLISEEEYAYYITLEQKKEVITLELDVDNSYVQNLLLAAENTPALKDVKEYDLWKLTASVREVFPQDRKTPELGVMLQFLKAWSETMYTDRGLLVKEWAKGNRVSAIQRTDTGTNAGGGIATDRSQDYAHTLDTLDIEIAAATLPMDFDIYNMPVSIHRHAREIIEKKESPFREWSAALRKTAGILDYSRAAIFALIRGAAENVHHFPVSLQTYISANLKEHQHDKPDAATVEAAQFSRETLDKQLAAGRGEYVEGISDPADPKWDKTPRKTFCTHEENLQRAREEGARRRAEEAAAQPKVENLGAGVFSIEGLTGNPPVNPDNGPVMGDATYQEMAEGLREELEITEDVQMETAVSNEIPAGTPVSTGEGADADHPQADAVTPSEIFAAAAPSLANHDQENVKQKPENAHQNDDSAHQNAQKVNQIEPEEHQDKSTVEYPAFFEPGRYEGLPNSVYHAANGISSTMVKDARVSLMFYHGRHVTKTIRRESSEALTFGSLTHTLTLEPEKLHEEFVVFPGVPEEAFTTTDSMKAFIREFNADKPKAEQLKLTGKKEELQAAIRAVNPGAIFADEFEQQWRDSVAGKTILSIEQLALATAIQQALLNHESAGKLLRHPSRSVETSYFGMDDETGLEVRVRPDLEVEINGVRIGVDLKTISMGRIKQDGLRARLHREIIDRDYHLSAGMYCSVADFDQFFWIFVNKDEGYHWVAVIEASEDLLALGMQEYQKTMRALAQAYDTNYWPAPITEDYTDELNDFDLHRLKALRTQA
ncbi:RecE family exodeoxyribonuclease [Atlantibacter subterraneus]|uniref:RecE family exodeoxyribonuclease n=1 Tax=Atlantibacter subterraneus TaxID=255519 RepID=UPI0022EB4F75|nr:RecE family exodeoxyribonuclease [Atlantibacter subterranea]MDA3133609.1 PD-(D/E)XK nuclease-like domain-containing protein [Atlantibacter subterranea]